VSGVVHTLGTLFEDADGTYKRAIKSGDVPGLLGSFLRNVVAGRSGGNPLEKHRQLGLQMKRGTYEVMNRDSGKLFVSFSSLNRRFLPPCLILLPYSAGLTYSNN
jgi:hypothetical protein